MKTSTILSNLRLKREELMGELHKIETAISVIEAAIESEKKDPPKPHALLTSRPVGALSGRVKRSIIEETARVVIKNNGGIATTADIAVATKLAREECGAQGILAYISSTLSRSSDFNFTAGEGWKIATTDYT